MEESAFNQNRCASAAIGSGALFGANACGASTIADFDYAALTSTAVRRDFRSIVEQLVDTASRVSGVAALVLTIGFGFYVLL